MTRNGLTEEQKLEIIEESKYIFEHDVKCVAELENTTWTNFRVLGHIS